MKDRNLKYALKLSLRVSILIAIGNAIAKAFNGYPVSDVLIDALLLFTISFTIFTLVTYPILTYVEKQILKKDEGK